MSQRPAGHNLPSPWTHAIIRRWAQTLARLALLLAIIALPVQMRAGADEAHAHSLLQLLLDARDGVIDHHSDLPGGGDHDHGHDNHVHGECAADPDVPELGQLNGAASGMPMLSALVVSMIIPGPQPSPVWPAAGRWRGMTPRPEAPPPRCE